MKTITYAIVVCLGISGQMMRAAEPTFKVIGLSINGCFSGQSDDFQPMHYEYGTKIGLWAGINGIVAIDTDSSEVRTFQDNKGGSMLGTNLGNGSAAKVNAFPKISADGTAALFEVSSPVTPQKGSERMTLSGVLAVKIASTTTNTISTKVRLAPGSRIPWGDKEFFVEKVERNSELVFSLRTDADVSSIRQIVLKDAAGNVAAATLRQSSTMEMGGRQQTTLYYECATLGDTFDVTVEFWKDMKLSKIPFFVEVGLGL